MDSERTFDIVVIGAGNSTFQNSQYKFHILTHFMIGISGIYAAKFYLDIHPQCRLMILDRDTCVGGVWNSSKSHVTLFPRVISMLTSVRKRIRIILDTMDSRYCGIFRPTYDQTT